MQREVWLTTLDNPFDPFEDNENWRRYDEDHGYFTNNLVARIAVTHDEMPDDVYNFQIEQAINEILRFNVTGLYRKAIKGENNVLPKEKRQELLKKMRSGEV